MTQETGSRSQLYFSLAEKFLPPRNSRELAISYSRIFLGPGKPIVHPYESAYLDGQLMGHIVSKVEKHYTKAGYTPNQKVRILPDHISMELAFMGHLATQNETKLTQGSIWYKRQHSFLDEHLTRWIPPLCEKILDSDPHPFYRQAALSTKKLILEDAVSFNLGGYRIQQHQETKIGKRFPNIHLNVDSARCTLCTLCVDGCRLNALNVSSTISVLTLHFNPSLCNGCQKCLLLCPEGAINIERKTPLNAPTFRPQKVIALTPRITCPICHQPHIGVKWVERLSQRLGGG